LDNSTRSLVISSDTILSVLEENTNDIIVISISLICEWICIWMQKHAVMFTVNQNMDVSKWP